MNVHDERLRSIQFNSKHTNYFNYFQLEIWIFDIADFSSGSKPFKTSRPQYNRKKIEYCGFQFTYQSQRLQNLSLKFNRNLIWKIVNSLSELQYAESTMHVSQDSKNFFIIPRQGCMKSSEKWKVLFMAGTIFSSDGELTPLWCSIAFVYEKIH